MNKFLDKHFPYMDEIQVAQTEEEVRPTLIFAVWACVIGASIAGFCVLGCLIQLVVA